MLKTFNCGIGFCLITKKKIVKKLKNYFFNNFKPFLIIKFIKNKKKRILFNEKIEW